MNTHLNFTLWSPLKRAFTGMLALWLWGGLGLCLRTAVSAQEANWRTDQILIKPKVGGRPGAGGPAMQAFHKAHGGRVKATFEHLGGLQVVALPAGASLTNLLAEYRRSGLVEYAEPDYLRHLDATVPNDPKFTDGTLWGLYNYGQSNGVVGADIDARDAWDIRTSASNIVVAILDTGVRATHEELALNMWTNPLDGTHGYNTYAGNTNSADDQGHGTLLAGVLGAAANNGKGVVGVAWRVQIMACKCFNAAGSGSDSTIIDAIDFARTHGARIINASFDSPGYSQSLSNAIYAASQEGILFVASAGNNTANIDIVPRYPAAYRIDNLISVAYTTRTDSIGGVSNYGNTNVDLFAPGDQIYSTYYGSDSSYFPPAILGISVAGTSFAASYVSGALALMMAQYPDLSSQQIKRLLLQSTDAVPALAGKCRTGGRLNLRQALARPELKLSAPVNGVSQLRVSTGPSRPCVLEVSADLQTWSPVATNVTSTEGIWDYPLPVSAGPLQSFYRVSAAR